MTDSVFEYPKLHYFRSGNRFSGSYKGLNYLITPKNDQLHIDVWYGPYCSAVSDMVDATDLPLSDEGLAESRRYLLQQYNNMPKGD